MIIFFRAFSNVDVSPLAPSALAVSRNRSYSSGSSGFSPCFGAGFLVMGRPYQPSRQSLRMKKNASCGSGNGNRAQTLQYRVFSLGDRLRVSRFIGETLATETLQGSIRTRHVVYAQTFAGVAVAEIKLGQVAVQMRFADVEIAAGDATLEDAEIVLDGIGVHVATHVFAPLVTYHFMVKISRHVAVLARVVGVQLRLLVNLAHQDRPADWLRKRCRHASSGHCRRAPPKRTRFSLPQLPPRRLLARLLRWRFFSFPPIKVSSASTALPSPPSGSSAPSFIASRMRWVKNHAVFMLHWSIR